MNKTLKWVIGILIGLLVVAAIIAAGYFAFARWYGPGWMVGMHDFRSWEGRRIMPIHPFEYWKRPGVRVGGFFLLRMIPGFLFNIGILTLIVLGVIYLARALKGPQLPSSQPPLPPTAQTPGACPSCGRSVQADWSHCPYCGNPLA
jgi:hypothetical protein